jgi:hypothetical protein
MSGVTGAVLAAIAAVFATIGFIMFGKPKATETSTRTATEQVVRPDPVNPEPKPLSKLPIEASIDAQPLPVGDASVDPWADEPAALTLDTVEQPEEGYGAIGSEFPTEGSTDDYADSSAEVAFNLGDEAPMELNLDDATQVDEPMQGSPITQSARYSSVAPNAPVSPVVQQVPYSVIQDPQRPASSELRSLSQNLLAWGNSGTAEDLKTVISYGQHPDPLIRRYVAVAIGQAAQGAIGSDIQSAVPVLEALSIDSDQKVQKMALKSLNTIQK